MKVTENCVENTDFAYAAASRPGHMPRQLPARLSGIRSIGLHDVRTDLKSREVLLPITRFTSCTFDGFRYDGDRGESSAGVVLLKARATNDGGCLLGEETSDGGAWGKMTARLL